MRQHQSYANLSLIIIQCFLHLICLLKMNKRKLEINEVKKISVKAKKHSTVTTKYEVALSFFKQKELKNNQIFSISFQPLIIQLLQQLSRVEIVYKLENQIRQQILPLQIADQNIRFQSQSFKSISKQFPIDQIMKCIAFRKDLQSNILYLEIIKTKLMSFFKHIRGIYPQFCFCVGEKIIVERHDLKSFYQTFKVEWGKLNEKGRMSSFERIQNMLCRSLYFVGALVENNIFQEIEEQQRKKKQENTQLGTKSEKKRNFKGIPHQVSSTYSFGSHDMLSNFSYGLNSEQSQGDNLLKPGYSEKSEKIVRKERSFLWEKAQIKNLKIKIFAEPQNNPHIEQTRPYINLLSNDVENILIEQAFKIKKLKDACEKNRFEGNPVYPYQTYLNYYQPTFYPQFQNYQPAQSYQNLYLHPNNNVSQDSDLYNIRRSFNFTNLVETRKTHSRMGGNKYS